jgi:hypothetical protein
MEKLDNVTDEIKKNRQKGRGNSGSQKLNLSKT